MVVKDRRLEKNESASGALSEESLRELLDDDCENDCIVAIRPNKISRQHYAQLLGCKASNLNQFCQIFAEYESKYHIDTVTNRRIPEMCDWINEAYNNRKLELRSGKLDRVAFRQHFSLTNDYLSRHW